MTIKFPINMLGGPIKSPINMPGGPMKSLINMSGGQSISKKSKLNLSFVSNGNLYIH